MPYKVIIAEKPSVATSIAKVIGANIQHRNGPTGYLEGNGYKVTWAFGHLVGLKSPEQMGYTSEMLPMFPERWETKVNTKKDDKGKDRPDPIVEKQLNLIGDLFRDAEEIIVATDAGREGELIFRYIYEFHGCRVPFRRLWISSLTDEAISKGMNDLKPGRQYDPLSDAAHSRSEADWLVGFNASKALRLSTGYKGAMSLGRVQTPTLCMICERYEQNRNFVPTPYWQIKADTEKSGTPFAALTAGRYESEQSAEEDNAKIRKACQLKVEDVEKKHRSTAPPLLHDLTSLQRAANGRHGLTAEETLKAAQSLYEKKYITYPRTGSRYIPQDVFKTIPSLLQKMTGLDEIGKYAQALAKGKLCRKSVNDSKVTDHHALLPTGNIPEDIKGNESKIYRLVATRTVEAFGENHEADITTVTLSAAGVIFKAKGSVNTHQGWKAVSGNAADDDEKKKDDEEQENGHLPDLAPGDLVPINDTEVLRKTNKPLPIYTDSSLLGEMETCGKKIDDEELRESMKETGLGTPATRASIIEALIKRAYVTREAKKLIPTEFGMLIWKTVRGRKIADVKTTGEWERDLALMEQGRKDRESFTKGIKEFVMEIIGDLKENCTNLTDFTTEKERTCPICGKVMKNQKFSVTCLPENGGCGFRISREIAGKKLPETAIDALAQGKTTAELKGFTSKSGKKFNCRLRLDRENRKIAFDIQPKTNEGKEVICPCCGKIMKFQTNKYICDCSFEIWTWMHGVKLTDEQFAALLSGKTVPIYGMKSKTGNTFNAKCRLDTMEKKIKMEFIKKK